MMSLLTVYVEVLKLNFKKVFLFLHFVLGIVKINTVLSLSENLEEILFNRFVLYFVILLMVKLLYFYTYLYL